MNDEEFATLKFGKWNKKRETNIFKRFAEFVSLKKLGPPLLFSGHLRKLKKLLLIHVECMEIFMELNNEDFHSSKFSKSKYWKVGQTIQSFYRIVFPQEIRSPLFNSGKLRIIEKITTEQCIMHWIEMSDKKSKSQ